MKKSNFSILLLILVMSFSCGLLLEGCSPQPVKHDFALRIKKESESLYGKVKETGSVRNASALRGNIESLEYNVIRCKDTVYRTYVYVVFQDMISGSPVERIPIEDVDLVGLKVGLDTNWFEYFNDPLNPNAIRQVPKKIILRDSCTKPSECPCTCESFDIRLPKIECPGKCRRYGFYFIEARGGYAAYNDQPPGYLPVEGRDAYFVELAVGLRFGEKNNWGLGLALSSGVPLYNSLGELKIDENGAIESTRRHVLMLHGRYHFDEFTCYKPFLYGQLGFAIDDLSLDLLCLTTYCQDCRNKIRASGGDFDFSIPLSFGFGVGVDIPLTCSFDLSFDLGFRSIAFGEQDLLTIAGMLLPTKRRVNMLAFRLGLTF